MDREPWAFAFGSLFRSMGMHRESWAFGFGVLGNITSIAVFLAPLPTFYNQIIRRRSTQGFKALPHVVALFSAMLWIYYAFVKGEAALLLITINTFGIVVEFAYLVVFLIRAPEQDRHSTIILLLLLNVFGFGAMFLSTHYLSKGATRLAIIGSICVVFNISAFAALLIYIIVQSRDRRTRRVELEYMQFLSFFLTINAVMWFFYGLLLKDYYVALPNTLGFVFGLIQMEIENAPQWH